jgi:HEAT repeat protein
MAGNPLLLTIIALIKWQGRTLPEQRVLLYDAAAQTLIKSWPLTQRRIEFDELFIREWLAPIALNILSERTGDLIDEFSLTEELSKIMQQLRSMTEMQARTATRELLDDISEHSGFLLPRDTDDAGNNLYGFLHQTFAEYLAAYYLVGRWEDGNLELARYAHDPYWREVFLLMGGHLGTQRRAKAGKFIESIRALNSSQYEEFVHRDLLRACQILADGTPAGPASVIESLLFELLTIWAETPLAALRQDIIDLFGKLRETEYAAVLERLIGQLKIQPYQTISLARAVGIQFVKDQLVKLLNEGEAEIRIAAAELLLGIHREQSISIALRLAEDEEMTVRTSAIKLLLNAEDIRGVPFLRDLFRDSEFEPWMGFADFKLPSNPDLLGAVAEFLGDANLEVQSNAAALLAHWKDPRGRETFVNFVVSVRTPFPTGFFGMINEFRNFDNEILQQLVKSTEETVRLFVGLALLERDDPTGIEPLLQMRSGAFQLIAPNLVGTKLPEAEAAINKLLESPDPEKHIHMASALLSTGDTRGRDLLVPYLSSDVFKRRIVAVEALVREHDLPVLESVRGILESSSKNDIALQRRAVVALGKIKSQKALEMLIAVLDDKRFLLSQMAAEILMTRNEPQAIQAMKDHIHDFTKVIQCDSWVISEKSYKSS